MVSFILPSRNNLSSVWGYSEEYGPKFHDGQDIGNEGPWDVYAAADGVVAQAGWTSGGYGNRVWIDHADGFETFYGHLSDWDVSTGQTVRQGQRIGTMGSTGLSYGVHLHWGMHLNGNSVNPMNYLSGFSGGGGTPISIGEEEMKIISVPGGSIALVGEFSKATYRSVSGADGFSIGTNRAIYGEASGLTEDQVATALRESDERRSGLVQEITAAVVKQLSAGLDIDVQAEISDADIQEISTAVVEALPKSYTVTADV